MIKQFAWGILKPLIKNWLQSRALVLTPEQSAAVAAKVSATTGRPVTPEEVAAVDQAMIAMVLTEIDTFKP